MKRMIIAASIVLVIIGVSVFSLWYVRQTTDEITTQIAYIKENANKNNYDDVMKNIEDIKKLWKDKEDKLIILIRHEQLDEINSIISALGDYYSNNEMGIFQAQCEKAINIIQHIWEAEKPNPHNIL